MADNIVVEWAPFELVESANEADLFEASQALQTEFLSSQQGFIRRELLRRDGRHWVDLVYWENDAAAQQAVKNAAGSTVCHRYFQLMTSADHDDPGAGVMHLARARVYS